MNEVQSPEPSAAARAIDSPRRHRRDIDGLRAVAILPVVAYHTGWSFLRGGFVGVDVFFVISGFLIAGQLQSDLEAQSFSILRFYERRVRRIAPALLVMLIVVSAMAAIAMFPIDLYHFGESLLATVFSVSNFYFFEYSGYFVGAGLSRPLLHTWSLAVEEQFYLLFPIILFGVWRLSIRMRNAALIGLLAVSFAASAVGAFLTPDAAFYLPYSRAWELLLGALLALGIVRCPENAAIRNAAAALGLLLVVASIIYLSSDMPFPGITALPPCAGAAMVIAAGIHGETLTGRLLSLGPLVFIGLISYSLYLWHWPLLAMQLTYHLFLPDTVSINVVRYLTVLAAILIAALSWKFVEQPFRDRSRISVPHLLAVCGAGATAALVCGTVLVFASGLSAGIPSDVTKIYAYLDYDTASTYQEGLCFLTSRNSMFGGLDRARCLKSGGGRDYLLFGDSHAADLWFGLKNTLKSGHLLMAASSGCKPLIPVAGDMRCRAVMSELYDDVLPSQHFAAILVSARWTANDLLRLENTMAWWKAHHLSIVLLGPSPEYDLDLPRLLAQSMLSHDAALPGRHLQTKFADLDRIMAHMAAAHDIAYVSLYRALCPNGKCIDRQGEVPLFFDGGHFTKEGSILAATKIEQANPFWK